MEKVRKELEALADEKYRAFSSKLIPNVNNMLGVRLPALRKIARQLAHNNFEPYLVKSDLLYFEEKMLQGMIIGYLDMSWRVKRKYIAKFVPTIDNWSVCDSFCVGLKFKAEERDEVWSFLQPYLKSKEAYEIRFAVVMLLSYYIDERYLSKLFLAFDNINHEDYYVKMSVAWAISTCFKKFPQATISYLKTSELDDWTYNKSLQKIVESLAVSDETKKRIESMRRGKRR